MTRCAILAGSSPAPGLRQKSLLNFHRFLTGAAGGSWLEKEILIMPDGVPADMLRLILRRLSENGTECALLYFCGNDSDLYAGDYFTVGGTRINRHIIENICSHQITVYDRCAAFVFDTADNNATAATNRDTITNINATIANTNTVTGDNNATAPRGHTPPAAIARVLADKILAAVDGEMFLTGCSAGEPPVFAADNSAIYTAALIESLETADTYLDLKSAHRNAKFALRLAAAAKETVFFEAKEK